MKILFTSDIHAHEDHLSSMLMTAEKEAVNCVIIGGDLIPNSSARNGLLEKQADYLKNRLIPSIKEFKAKNDISFFMDMGNDDLIFNRSILEEYDSKLFHLIHQQKIRISDDVDLIGYMNVPPTPFGIKDWEKPDSLFMPYAEENKIEVKGFTSLDGLLEETVLDLEGDDNIERDMAMLSEKIDRPFIFISHSPPYKTPLDIVHSGLHVGSISIRKFIEKWSEKGMLLASFHGHIHESPFESGSIFTSINRALCLNPGQGNGNGIGFRYVIINLAGNRIDWVKEA